MRIDTERVKKIIQATGNSAESASLAIGYSKNFLSNVFHRGTIQPVAIKALQTIGIDISSAVIIEQEETNPAKEEKGAGWLKVIEDYSYIRSNDADRITAAIDRLTAVLQEINRKL